MKYTTIRRQPNIYNVYHQKISSSFPYLQSVLSVYHLNKYRALRSTCRLSASFVFEEHRASKLASCLRAELLNETTTSCLSACSIEVKESKTHSSHAHLRFWKLHVFLQWSFMYGNKFSKLSNNNTWRIIPFSK